MNTDDTPKKPLRSTVVYQNQWITVREDTTVTTDGQKGLYGYLESRDSVMVAAFDEQDRICLVRSFCYPSQSWGWEFPGGGGEGEELIAASKRELEEETGIIAENWERVGHTLVCNGLMTERMTTCVAHGLRYDGQKEDSDEIIADMQFVTLAQADELVATGEINDGQTITALYVARQWYEKAHASGEA